MSFESWPTREMQSLDRSFKDLENLIRDLPVSEEPEKSAALARFLVIRTCGYLEQVVEKSCVAYLENKSDFRSASFSRSWFGAGANPTPTKLVKLVSKFDPVWSESLNELFKRNDELLFREVSYLVDRRNKIAHGVNENVNIRKALDLVEHARKVAEWFTETFKPIHSDQ